jgi:hypothetical protein
MLAWGREARRGPRGMSRTRAWAFGLVLGLKRGVCCGGWTKCWPSGWLDEAWALW